MQFIKNTLYVCGAYVAFMSGVGFLLSQAFAGECEISASLPGGCSSPLAAESKGPEPSYNVLFIAVDDLRPVLGCYGCADVQTPNLDALAERGTVFRRAYCQLPICMPSRTSVLTGLRPETTGILSNRAPHFRSRFPDHVCLPQHFKNHGAFCMSFGKMFHCQDPASWSVQKWIPKGNPFYPIYGKPETIALQLEKGHVPTKPSDWWGFQEGRNSRWAKAVAWEAPDVPDGALFDGQLADAVIKVLRERRREPFFLAPGFFRPHLPFIAPKPYFDMYPSDKLELPPNRELPEDAPSFVHHDSAEARSYLDIPKNGQAISEEKQLELLRGYYASVTYVDAQIGRVLDELDRLGLTDETVVMLWSDHGFHFGEHGTWGKPTNFEEATRSTLIVSVPSQPRSGTATDGLVELLDMYPTLCELCELPVPEGLEGASFAPLLEAPDRAGKRAVLSQANPHGRMGRTMRTDRYRYTEWTPKGATVAVEVYDHRTDPGENVNVAAKPENWALVDELARQFRTAWASEPVGGQETTEGLLLADSCEYEALRSRIRSKDDAIEPWGDRLRRRAQHYCNSLAPAVTDKSFTPHSPSQDPHDYVSIGTYWWPNPESEDGLPYIRRDGRLSPDVELYDRKRWERAADGIVTTAKAAYFLDEPRFAEEAVTRVRRWFLDAETRMNPHLPYVQMIPGRCTGGNYGVIDFSIYLPTVLDHIRLLATLDESPWTAEDQQGMVDWCDSFLMWLENHKFGRKEEATTNNHAVYYDRMVVYLALFLDRPKRARVQLERTRKRIALQIKPDGSMPRELGRTCTFGYTTMNTRGFVELTWMGRHVDVDLWTDTSDDGRSIPTAVDFLYRHVCSRDPWPFKQIEPIDWRMVCPVLRKAESLSDQRYDLAQMAHRMPGGFDPDFFLLIEPIHPFGKLRSPK